MIFFLQCSEVHFISSSESTENHKNKFQNQLFFVHIRVFTNLLSEPEQLRLPPTKLENFVVSQRLRGSGQERNRLSFKGVNLHSLLSSRNGRFQGTHIWLELYPLPSKHQNYFCRHQSFPCSNKKHPLSGVCIQQLLRQRCFSLNQHPYNELMLAVATCVCQDHKPFKST